MEDEKEGKRASKFFVTITGNNTHFECPIDNMNDFEDLDRILKVLKKKL